MTTTAAACCNGLPARWTAPYLKPGDTYPALSFTFTESGTSDPLTFPDGTTALAQIRDKRRNAVVHTFGAVVSANVITLLAVPAAETLLLPQGRHWFELETSTAGTVTTWVDSAEIVIGQDHAHV